MCLSASVVAYAYGAAAIEHRRDDKQAARTDTQVESFVVSAAAAANKQNYKYNPGTIAATVIVVKQTVKHKVVTSSEIIFFPSGKMWLQFTVWQKAEKCYLPSAAQILSCLFTKNIMCDIMHTARMACQRD